MSSKRAARCREIRIAPRTVRFRYSPESFWRKAKFPAPNYWRLHVLQGAQFEEGIETLAAQGYDHFLEVGPPSSFPESGRLRDPETKATWFSSLESRSRRLAEHAHEPGFVVRPRRQRRLEGLR